MDLDKQRGSGSGLEIDRDRDRDTKRKIERVTGRQADRQTEAERCGEWAEQ